MKTSSLRRLTALAVTGIALAAPSAASATPIVNNVAIGTSVTYYAGVLDVAGGSTSLGAKVIQYPATGGSNQRWNFVAAPGGTAQIVNQKSGMCLTTSGVAGTQLYLWTCNGGPRQRWGGDLGLIQAWADGRPQTPSGGIFNPETDLYVDVKGGSGLAGTPIITWYPNSGRNQKFAYYQLG
jgi:Ricin-type beta-trefoil lectin domain-like